MHIPEFDESFLSEFDPEAYVKHLKDAGIEVAYLNTNNCLGLYYWDTELGRRHERMGNRDFIAEEIAACRKNGIRPVLYANYWSRYDFERHPDWRCVAPDGKTSLERIRPFGRFGVCCMNSPFQQAMEDRIAELVRKYDAEGLWLDMAGAFFLCTCAHCRARFKAETGMDLPERVDWRDASWKAFVKIRSRWVCESLEKLNAAARRVRPDIAVAHNSARYSQNMIRCESADYYKMSDYVSGDYTAGRQHHSFFSKFFYHVSKNKPAEFLCPIMAGLEEHNVIKTENQLSVLLYSCLANNVRFGTIDAVDPVGTLNGEVYERIRKVYDEAERYRPWLEADTENLAETGLYCGYDCPVDERENGMPLYSRIEDNRHFETTRELAILLKKLHVPYRIVTPDRLEDLKKCRTLLMSEVNVLSRAEVEAIRSFVQAGGALYASGETGRFDENYDEVRGGGLSEVLGVEICGRETETHSYIRPVGKERDAFLYFDETHPLCCGHGETCANVRARKDAEILAKITYPYRNEALPDAYSSAISDPPWERTELPALVGHRFGKGRTLYSAYPIEILKTRDQNKVFFNLFEHLAGRLQLRTDAPDCVEATFLRQERSGRLIFSLLNDQMAEENIPIRDFGIQLKLGARPESVYSVTDGKEIPFEWKEGVLSLRIGELKIYQMLVFKIGGKDK